MTPPTITDADIEVEYLMETSTASRDDDEGGSGDDDGGSGGDSDFGQPL